jgi:adenosylhomocysteine nucleosidase
MTMKIVIVISANAEWKVVKPLFPDAKIEQSPFGEFADVTVDTRNLTLFHGGWGKISAAATAQYVIDHFKPDLLVNLGTCGGFEGRIERGTIILVEKTIVYDIIEQMTDGEEEIVFYTTDLDLSWLPRVLPSPVLRGLLVSGDRDIVVEDIPTLIEKYGAVAADWESGAIAWTAGKNGVRTLILRGVSDLVNPSGGEAYGDYELFIQRTREIMKKLFDKLPVWLAAIERVEQGYRGY